MTKAFRLLLLTVVVFATSISWAQTSKGTVAGIITDSTGAAVPNADVTAKDQLGGESRTVKSGPNGEYRIEAISPSTYTVSVTAAGFATKKVTDLRVAGSIVTSLNVGLEVGTLEQTVAVEASAAQIQTETGDLTGTITTQEITKLPISSLNPIQLVLTQPGVVSFPAGQPGAFSNGVNFAVDGLRPRSNNFLIDGFDNNDAAIAGQALQPSNVEAYGEVLVLRNSYAPEFGRGGGSVTNILTKNGTNQFHGALWERYHASALDAISPELQRSGATSVPRYDENTFGFAAGGPVVKNKLFFFGTAQWDRTKGNETGLQLTIPTATGVSVLQGLASTNPNANIIINSLGGLTAPSQSGAINVGNRAGCGSPCLVPVGPITRVVPQQANGWEYLTRVDYNSSEKDTFNARYIGTKSSLSPDFFANGGTLPTQDSFQGGPARNLGVFWTHVFDPTRINEFRFTWQSINFTFGLLPATLSNPLYNIPTITISGMPGVFFGSASQATFPQGRGHNTYQYQDAFSWVVGSHSLKIGADLTHYAIADIIPFNAVGTVGIARGGDCSAIGLASCTGLANFLDNFTGPTGTAGKQFGNPYLSFAQNTEAFYAQDSWKVRPNLTVTYGLRWEYFDTPFNSMAYPAINLGTVLTDPINTRYTQKPDRNNFGPRIGLAWTPDFLHSIFGEGKTVIRAGGGMFYDMFFTNIEDNVLSSAPNTLGGTVTAPNSGRGTANPVGQVNAVQATLNPRANVSVVTNDLHAPKTYQWNFNIERQLPGSMLLTLAYVGTRGTDLFINRQLNPGVENARLNPAKGSIGARTNTGDSIYHGFQIDLTRRFRSGFMLDANYTFSKDIDNGSEVFVTTGGSSYAQNSFNWNGDRGLSVYDRPHRVSLTWLYTVPFRGGAGSMAANVTKYLVRNWTFSGTMQIQSGAPGNIYMGGYDQNHDLNGFNDRPWVFNKNAPINYSDACLASPTCITGIGYVDPANGVPLQDFNTGAIGTPDQFRYVVVEGTMGTLGRNTYRDPFTQEWSMAIERIFPIPRLEGHQLEFRAEAFNPFNHPNPGVVSTDILDPNFLNKGIVTTGSRSVVLWLKYRF